MKKDVFKLLIRDFIERDLSQVKERELSLPMLLLGFYSNRIYFTNSFSILPGHPQSPGPGQEHGGLALEAEGGIWVGLWGFF